MIETTIEGVRDDSGIAHDLNNKLATIIGTVDLLLSQTDGEGELRDGLRDVLAAALKMQELVRRIPRCRPA
jgi:signal transduction histidine kinase